MPKKVIKSKKVVKKVKKVTKSKKVIKVRAVKSRGYGVVPIRKMEPADVPVRQTQEQKAGVPNVISNTNFEKNVDISKLDLRDQMNIVFNPLQAITKTDVRDNVSEATHIVHPKPE